MNNHPPQIPILLLFGLLTSGGGCQVLNIPSYRADSCGAAGFASMSSSETGASESSCGTELGGMPLNDCPPSFLPPIPVWRPVGVPIPGWWAEGKAKRDLPEPAPYPRFQPLPTRPMFSPPVQALPMNSLGAAGVEAWQTGNPPAAPPGYGQMP